MLPETANASGSDFFFIERASPEDVLATIKQLVSQRLIGNFGITSGNEIQVLTPMNRSELGARNLNARLQEVLNPPGKGPQIERFGWTYRLGDKVQVTVVRVDLQRRQLDLRVVEKK